MGSTTSDANAETVIPRMLGSSLMNLSKVTMVIEMPSRKA